MQSAQAKNLVRKQIMLSNANINKLEKIAKANNSSVAEIVRTAVESYDPDADDINMAELQEIVSIRLKEAIEDTAKTRKHLNKTLKALETRRVA